MLNNMAVLDSAAPGRPAFIVGHSLGGFVTSGGAAPGDPPCRHSCLDSRSSRLKSIAPRIRFKVKRRGISMRRAEALRRIRLIPPERVGCHFYQTISPFIPSSKRRAVAMEIRPAAVGSAAHGVHQALLDMRCNVRCSSASLRAGRWRDSGLHAQPLWQAYAVIELANAESSRLLEEPLPGRCPAYPVAMVSEENGSGRRMTDSMIEFPWHKGLPYQAQPPGKAECLELDMRTALWEQ